MQRNFEAPVTPITTITVEHRDEAPFQIGVRRIEAGLAVVSDTHIVDPTKAHLDPQPGDIDFTPALDRYENPARIPERPSQTPAAAVRDSVVDTGIVTASLANRTGRAAWNNKRPLAIGAAAFALLGVAGNSDMNMAKDSAGIGKNNVHTTDQK